MPSCVHTIALVMYIFTYICTHTCVYGHVHMYVCLLLLPPRPKSRSGRDAAAKRPRSGRDAATKWPRSGREAAAKRRGRDAKTKKQHRTKTKKQHPCQDEKAASVFEAKPGLKFCFPLWYPSSPVEAASDPLKYYNVLTRMWPQGLKTPYTEPLRPTFKKTRFCRSASKVLTMVVEAGSILRPHYNKHLEICAIVC